MSWDKNLEKGSSAHNFASSNAKVIKTIAGPGSGKSFAIGRRIARLIEEGADPNSILAITFTKTAARDLKSDISGLEVVGSEDVVTKTLHSHALSILMDADVISATQRHPRMILEHEMEASFRDIDNEKYGDVKSKKKLNDAFLAAWATSQDIKPGFAQDDTQRSFEKDMVQWMKDKKGMQIGEVIPEVNKFLLMNPTCPEIGKYKVILVDEYQDLNRSEQEFIKLIRGEKTDLVVVGDDDQSIYGFKHAYPQGIRELDVVHGDSEEINFAECRRCPQKVTRLASHLISRNTNRTLAELVPFQDNAEGEVDIVQWPGIGDEIRGIVNMVKKDIKSLLIEPKDVLILVPRRQMGYDIRGRFLDDGIPAESYFREEAIKQKNAKFAYSSLVNSVFPEDLVSLRFLLGCSSKSYLKKQYKLLQTESANHRVDLIELLDKINDGSLTIKGLSNIVKRYQDILIMRPRILDQLKKQPDLLFEEIFINTDEDRADLHQLSSIYEDVLASYKDYDENEDFEKWLRGLVNEYQKAITNPDVPTEVDHVRIMSLHASKGLSAPYVVVGGQIQGFIPGSRAITEKDIEEQRRLFYVAITRCKSSSKYTGKLVISNFSKIEMRHALPLGIEVQGKGRWYTTQTSQFVYEMGPETPAAKIG